MGGWLGTVSQQLSNPANVAPVAGGALLLGISVLYYHTLLKVLGLWGLGATLYTAVTNGTLESSVRKVAAAAGPGSRAKADARSAMQVTTGAYKPPAAAAAEGKPDA